MEGQVIILQGGEDIQKRENKALMEKVSKISTTKKVVVIPWTTPSLSEEMKYRPILYNYFIDSGFEKVLFLERSESSNEMIRKMVSADVVYLPGGDPEVLYREIYARTLQYYLRKFKGIIIGNSAGAIILSRGMHEGNHLKKGFGIIDAFVRVHFEFSENCAPDDDGLTINIPEGMWVSMMRKEQ